MVTIDRMRVRSTELLAGLRAAVLCIGLAATALTQAAPLNPEFSLDPASPSNVGAVTPDDILTAGPVVRTPGTAFGLLDGLGAGVFDNLADFSHGNERIVGPLYFSVDRVAAGLPGTAVFARALPGVEAAAADIYQSVPPFGTNLLTLPGNALGLQAGPFGQSDDIDGLTFDQGPLTYFAIDRFSATNGFGAADLQNDILFSNGGGGFGIFALDVSMGLLLGDAIDGLVLDVSAMTALLSLDPFSPSTYTFTGLNYLPCVPGHMSPADICITHFQGSYALWASAASLGLRDSDNVDAIATPAPGTLPLVALGLAALLGSRRGRAFAWPALACGLCLAAALPGPAWARDPADPGKGFDYVFYGADPALPKAVLNGSANNRGMLLLDIDKPGSPRPYPTGPKFKLLAESPVGSGVLEVLTITPTTNTLLGIQSNNPERFLFTFSGTADNGGAVLITQDALLEVYNQHYLRSVVDVVHKSRRTRYLVNCVPFTCDVADRPY